MTAGGLLLKVRMCLPGAREPGQGVDEEEQGVVTAERTPSGCAYIEPDSNYCAHILQKAEQLRWCRGALLRVTLLAAGFLIGRQRQPQKPPR